MEYEDFTYKNIHNETNIRIKELDREREENIKRITEEYKKHLIFKIRIASSSGKYELIVKEKDFADKVVDFDWFIFTSVMENLESFFKERGFTYIKKYYADITNRIVFVEISWR